MNERHGALLVLATARRDAAGSQITLGRLVHYCYFTHLIGVRYDVSHRTRYKILMTHYPVQLIVETTRVADGMSISGATPQCRLRRAAVGTAHTSAGDHALLQTPS